MIAVAMLSLIGAHPTFFFHPNLYISCWLTFSSNRTLFLLTYKVKWGWKGIIFSNEFAYYFIFSTDFSLKSVNYEVGNALLFDELS